MAAGRPNKYKQWLTPEGLQQLEEWARMGLTDDQIAHNMGIAYSTFYDYKARFKEFSEALKRGKAIVDQHVENALLKRALGYHYDEITKEPGTEVDPITGIKKKAMVEVKRVTKEVHGDTTAQIFWLKNRKPKEWRDKQQIDHMHNIGEDLTPEERKARIEELQNKLSP